MANRRFIAGAVCPHCHVEDRLVVEEIDGIATRRCVSCGFSDQLTPRQAVTVPTRFVRRGLANVDSTPVRILDD